MKAFSERLKSLRTEKGLSQKDLAKIIGVTDMAICKWETNQTDVTGENLIKLAEFFHVTLDFLMGVED